MMMGTAMELTRISEEGRAAGLSEDEIQRRRAEFLDEMYEVHKSFAWGATKGGVKGFISGGLLGSFLGSIFGGIKELDKE